MSIPIKFYRFSKPTNSTKLPSESTNLLGAYQCTMIESTTIQAPGIRLDLTDLGNPPSYSPFDFNYAYIEQFKRYYWVNTIEYDLGTWIFSLEVDVLASLRGTIGASSQYVMRSAYTFDGTITDSFYPIKNDYTDSLLIETTNSIFSAQSSMEAWYIVGIIGGLSSEAFAYYETYLGLNTSKIYNGSVMYFVLTDAQVRELMQLLLGSADIYDIETTEMSEALQKQLLNPIQYIESIRCVPYKPDVMSYNDQDIIVPKVQFGFSFLDIDTGSDPEPSPPVPPVPQSEEAEEEEEEEEPEVGNEGDITPQASVRGWRILRRPRITYALRNISSGEGWIKHHSFTMHLPVHPQGSSRGAWVYGNPTSSYTIEVEPFGLIAIPGNVPIQASRTTVNNVYGFDIKFETWTDSVTGMCKLLISYLTGQSTWHTFFDQSQDISITLPCHQSIQDASSYFRAWTNLNVEQHNKWLNWIGSAFGGGISGGTSGGEAGGAISVGTGLVSGIFNAGAQVNQYYRATKPQAKLSMLEANMPRIEGSGATGGSYISFASDFCSPRVHCFFSILADDNNTDHGRPLCQIRQISTIPGYIECDHPHFTDSVIPLTALEREQALKYMEGGFFYE